MNSDLLHSSDAIRSAAPLRHARTAVIPGPVRLLHGSVLDHIDVTYETYGKLNAAADNAILICHALSGDSHVARHDEADDAGWWDVLVGPGKPIDTDRFFVVCPNLLGGCRGTTGPGSIDPRTGRPFGPDFPVITVEDMVDVQRALIESLGIRRLLAVVGGSLGGQVAMCWAVRHPQMVASVVPVATCARLSSQALAFDVVARNAIVRDPHFHGGHYYDKPTRPDVGLALARMLGHITYLSREAMTAKFDVQRMAPADLATEFEKKFTVGSYLAHQGHKFVERFDANCYITLSMALDLFDLGADESQLAASFAATQCRWLVISFSGDWLFPPSQSRQIVNALTSLGHPVSFCDVRSDSGHDAFLLEDEVAVYGGLIGGFLNHVAGSGVVEQGDGSGPQRGSIFHGNRLDEQMICDLIPPGASVLDLGCGDGRLLARLRERDWAPGEGRERGPFRGQGRLMGVELDEMCLVQCVGRGLDVVQADLNRAMPGFGDGQFDCVVLSQTLQAVRDVERLIGEMLRIGRRAIVSFPNFAHRPLRESFERTGRMPRTALMPDAWYATANVRFLTILDFVDFCRERGLVVERQVALDTEAGRVVAEDRAADDADLAIFMIRRGNTTA